MFQFSENNVLNNKRGECDEYKYPNLYEEADEMLQTSLLIYSIADLRSLAKDPKIKDKLKAPENILDMPLSIRTCLQALENNYVVMKECLGEVDHINTINSLHIIHARFRFQKHHSMTDGSIEVEEVEPMLTYFGDENSDSDIVYAVGINQRRKRITVAFRGSVTSTDFQKDAKISINPQPNPVKCIDSKQHEKVGIHHGFYDYLLRPRNNGMNKYQEIMEHVQALFLESDRQQNYKLYCTGHSLGGALATLFSLYAAADSVADSVSEAVRIPTPVICISVASPRVGDGSFQSAFGQLEERGLLRHLRIANDRDPVTMMPSATGKKVWATLSPISYLAFKLIDNKFDEKENFCHTGVKLRLAKERWELSFMGVPIVIDEEEQEEKAVGTSTESSSEFVVDPARGSSRSFRSILSISTRSKSLDSSNESKIPIVIDEEEQEGKAAGASIESSSEIVVDPARESSWSFRSILSMSTRSKSQDSFNESQVPIIIDEEEQEGKAEGTSIESSSKIVVDPAPRRSGSSKSFRSILSKSTRFKSQDSFNESQIPNVAYHLGNAYVENLSSVKHELLDLSLSDIYKAKTFQIISKKGPKN